MRVKYFYSYLDEKRRVNFFYILCKPASNLIYAFTGKDNLTDLAAEAARKALEMAEVDPNDVDLILLCSSTPDDLFGSAPQV